MSSSHVTSTRTCSSKTPCRPSLGKIETQSLQQLAPGTQVATHGPTPAAGVEPPHSHCSLQQLVFKHVTPVPWLGVKDPYTFQQVMQGIHSLHQLAPVRVEALQPQPDSRSWHPAHSPVSLQLAPWLKVCGALSRSREGPPTTGATTLTHSSSWSEGAYTCRLTRVAGTQVYS